MKDEIPKLAEDSSNTFTATCHEHQEYHTGCVSCQHDCIEENEILKVILQSYRIQTRSAMKATSLGLCKKVISHAFYDEKKILEGKWQV